MLDDIIGPISGGLGKLDDLFTTWYNNKWLHYFLLGLVAFFIVVVVWN